MSILLLHVTLARRFVLKVHQCTYVPVILIYIVNSIRLYILRYCAYPHINVNVIYILYYFFHIG